MPVPSRRLKSKMVFWFKMAFLRSKVTNNKECCPNNHMCAVEARSHIKSRTINTARKRERGMTVFVGLDTSEKQSKENCVSQSLDKAITITFTQGMVSPRNRATR